MEGRQEGWRKKEGNEKNERVNSGREGARLVKVGERGEKDRRSLFNASAQRVVEITQAGEITFSFCPQLGQRQKKKKRDHRSEKEYLVEKMDME